MKHTGAVPGPTPPLDVPLALIRQICYPQSYRLPPLDVMIFPTPKDALVTPKQLTGFVTHGGFTRHTYYPDRVASGTASSGSVVAVMGNLDNAEYRFFVGRNVVYPVTWSQCRWCLSSCLGAEERKKHGDSHPGCKHALLLLYKKWRNDCPEVCSSCGKTTKRCTWGIPLCSISCDNLWRFNMSSKLSRDRLLFKEEFEP